MGKKWSEKWEYFSKIKINVVFKMAEGYNHWKYKQNTLSLNFRILRENI